MQNKIFILILGLTLGFDSIGQLSPKNDKPIEVRGYAKTKSLAKHSIKIGDAYSALYYYEQLHDMRPDDLEITSKLADLYKLTRSYGSASLAYGKLYKADKIKYKSALYERGVMQKMQGKYDSAIVSLEEYQRVAGKGIPKKLRNQLKTDIRGCDSALFYLSFPENVEVLNLGSSVNNPHVEFGPIPFDTNTILFGSLTSDTVHFYDKRYGKEEAVPHRKFYTAKRTGDTWERVGEMEAFNDLNYEMGKIVYSKPSKTYYFTKCKKNSKGINRCVIYSSKVKNGEPQEPEELPTMINLPGFTTTQPTVYYDAKKKREYIYFASNRPGTRGGLDIFYTYYDKKKKSWKKPKGLNKINTSGTECTPFYNLDEKALYYSTDGKPGMGGLDVFKLARDENNRYLPLENLGYPVNSPQDDLDYSVYPEGKKGFIVSNRPGGTPYLHETCCDDIFSVEYIPLVPFEADLNLLVVDSNGDTLASDQVIVVKQNLRTGKVSRDTVALTSGSDVFELNPDYHYDFFVAHEGYEPQKFDLDTKGMRQEEHLAKVVPLKKLEPVVVPVDTLENVVAVVEEVVKEEVPEVVEEIAVVEEIKEEVPVVEEIIEPEVVEEIAVVEEVVKEEVPVSEIKIETKEEVVKEEVVEEEVWPPKDTFKPNEKIRLKIHYAFDKYYLTKDDKFELDSLLIPYMKLHDHTKAVLSSHTDNWGGDTYNQYLSEKRAESVVNYLVKSGISKNRLQWKGYGESKPFLPNSVNGKDSIENRKLNRRTEVEIIY